MKKQLLRLELAMASRWKESLVMLRWTQQNKTADTDWVSSVIRMSFHFRRDDAKDGTSHKKANGTVEKVVYVV